MRLTITLVIVSAFAALTSAQVSAPQSAGFQDIHTQSQKVAIRPDGTALLTGNVSVSVTGPVEIRAEEVELSRDGRNIVLRKDATVTIVSNARTPAK
jgi:lipopolysaccharide export system protein LptA